MNIAEPVFGMIPIQNIVPSKTNPRKRFDDMALNELAKSIKQQGLGQPILVRPLPKTKGKDDLVEIVAGERRYRACKLAELTAMPAIVREMTDVEAVTFQLVENLQREDVHPIEEAEGYERLMQDHKFTVEQCAAEVGKSKAYIYARLKLCALIPEARTAFYDGKLTASTALLIARIPHAKLQAQAAKEVINPSGEPMSYRAAVAHVQCRYMLELDAARFSLLDEKLVASAGACSTCPKRTGNAPDLFQDVKSADVCIDPDCFASKRAAHDAKCLAQAHKKNIKVIEAKSIHDITDNNAKLICLETALWQFDRVSPTAPTGKFLGNILAKDLLPPVKSYAKLPGGEVEPLYEKTAIQAALEKAGLCLTIEQHTEAMKAKTAIDKTAKKAVLSDKEKKELEKRAAAERTAKGESSFRLALYKQIREAVLKPGASTTEALRSCVQLMSTDYYIQDSVKSLYDFNPRDAKKLDAYVEKATDAQLVVFLLDLGIGAQLDVAWHSVDDGEYLNDLERLCLLKMAKSCAIDTDALQAAVAPADQPTPALKPKAIKDPKPVAAKPGKGSGKTPAAAKPAAPEKDAKAKLIDPAAAWPFPIGTRP